MTTSLLFLCPHNAAKSVAAAAFTVRLAAERGVAVTVATAGTDPDAEVLPLVRDRLESEGHVVESVPRLITEQDVTHADHIINIGCSLSDLPTGANPTEWDIPNFSDNPDAAFAALNSEVANLVEELASAGSN